MIGEKLYSLPLQTATLLHSCNFRNPYCACLYFWMFETIYTMLKHIICSTSFMIKWIESQVKRWKRNDGTIINMPKKITVSVLKNDKRRIQNSVKYLKWSFFDQLLTRSRQIARPMPIRRARGAPDLLGAHI